MNIFDNRELMLKHYIREGSVGAEIGVFEGVLSEFLYSLKPSKLYLIDVFEGICSSGNQDGNYCKCLDLNTSYNNLKEKYKDDNRVVIYKGLAESFYHTIEDDHLDFIYIDGGHSYDCVLNDLNYARNKVKNGGIIMGHDYGINPDKTKERYDFGVEAAVNTYLTKYNNQKIAAMAMDGCTSYCIINEKL